MTDDEQLRCACEAALWTGLAKNNPDIVLIETMLSEMIDLMVNGGVYLVDGKLRFPSD